MGAGVQPGIAARQLLDEQVPGFHVHAIEVRDLELAARRGAHLLGELDHAIVIKIEAGDSLARLRLNRLLLKAHGSAGVVELHHPVGLRLVDLVGEDRRPVLAVGGVLQQPAHPGAEEDIVAQHQGGALVADEVLADQERLRQPFGLRLNRILDPEPEVRTILKQPAVVVDVLRRRDDQDVPDAGQHEHRQRVVDHRLVIDRQQLLVYRQRRRMQPSARTTGQDDALHLKSLFLLGGKQRLNNLFHRRPPRARFDPVVGPQLGHIQA